MALSPQANYTDWATAPCRRNLVPTFVDRGMSRGQRGWSPAAVNLSFLDRNVYKLCWDIDELYLLSPTEYVRLEGKMESSSWNAMF
jgi:hypothetical protein